MTIGKSKYRWFYDHVHSRYYDLVMKWCYAPFGGEKKCRRGMIEHIDFEKGEMILDMCCGTGGATASIVARVESTSSVVGVDLSEGQLRVARKKRWPENVRFVRSDVIATSFPENHFDKVFITHALHEMTHDVRLKVLREARRVVRENGSVIALEVDNPPNLLTRLFIGFWFFYWLPFNFETSTRRDMLRRGLNNEFKKAGFGNVTKRNLFKGVIQVVEGRK